MRRPIPWTWACSLCSVRSVHQHQPQGNTDSTLIVSAATKQSCPMMKRTGSEPGNAGWEISATAGPAEMKGVLTGTSHGPRHRARCRHASKGRFVFHSAPPTYSHPRRLVYALS